MFLILFRIDRNFSRTRTTITNGKVLMSGYCTDFVKFSICIFFACRIRDLLLQLLI
ncbi:hypothetical protein KZ369_05640 [Glaesserella parasuis]|nr:hypothetical protein [Glaesserella parasuis]